MEYQNFRLELATVEDGKKKIVHHSVRDMEAYDTWHLSWYFKEILQYQSLTANIKNVRLEDIPRKEKNIFLYEIFRCLNFKLKYLELGSSLFEVIDGLEFIARLLGEHVDFSKVSFAGLETSGLFCRGAERLHPAYSLHQFSDPSLITRHDVLYDRAVSSYCFQSSDELGSAMNKARVGFSNLFLRRTDTRIERNHLGRPLTYFGLSGLIKSLDKPLYYLFGREKEDKIEGFFLCCSSDDFDLMMRGFGKNRWLQQFMDQKGVRVRDAKTLL